MFRTALVSMFITSTALADTWTVDDDGKADFNNIQAAVDASSDGDEIIVMPGTYQEQIDLNGLAILLQSIKGSEFTIIDAGGIGSAIICQSGEGPSTVIEGFTLTGGVGSPWPNGSSDPDIGGGIYCRKPVYQGYSIPGPTIKNCLITGNYAGRYGGGAGCVLVDAIFEHCTFKNNSALYRGGGFSAHYSNPILTDCTVENNTINYSSGGGIRNSYSNTILNGCIIRNNNGGGVDSYESSPILVDTIICANELYQISGTWKDGGGNTIADVCPDQDCNENGIWDAIEIVDTSNVRLYEITINDQTRNQFGSSLAMEDDLIIIGDPSDYNGPEPGRVHVYRRQGFDWNLETTLFPPDKPNTQAFGSEVATDGLSIVVTSSLENAVYIYHFDGTTWNFESFLEAKDTKGEWSYGHDVAIDGDVAVVGDGEDGHNTCYIYRRMNNQWHEEAQLHGDENCGDFSYFKLDIDGDTIAIGGCSSSGFVYDYSEESGWIRSTLTGPPEYPVFAGGLTLKGDTIVCGGDTWASEPYVHVFRRESEQWFHEGIIEPNLPDGFGGKQVSLGRIFNLTGNLLVVSTRTEHVSESLRTAFAFRMVDGEWQQVAHLDIPAIYQGDPQMSGYGYTIASDRERVAISSCGDSAGPVVASPVFVFDLSLDCDQDGLIDICEIVSGDVVDADGDGVPDFCECQADISGDGYVNVSDLLAVIDQWGSTDSDADVNGDGIVNVTDLLEVVGNWGPCE